MSSPHGSPAAEDSIALVVSEQWFDEICEQVGSLHAVLQALTRLPGFDRPHTLVSEAIDNCGDLQTLLNQVPVWGGWAGSAIRFSQHAVSQTEVTEPDAACETYDDVEDVVPLIDAGCLEERCGRDVDEMIRMLRQFRERAEGDVRQLELLSIGHDWTRLARLAGMLKNSATRVSAVRVVADAAALQGAARVGCRHDVEHALHAIREDLNRCGEQAEEWRTSLTGVC